MGKPIVAIIGRQNVGKSTLLNRMVGKPLAIVEDFPGTTRDRVFAPVSWQGVVFTLVDTGGLEMGDRSAIGLGVREQIESALSEADVVVFLVDVRSGVIASDLEAAEMLRRANKPVLVAANKADDEKLEAGAVEFYRLGLGEALPISAYHDKGISDMLDRIVTLLPVPASAEPETEVMRLAIAGRPNVGKSMLLNALVGQKRAIVDEKPGTTRDALDTLVDFDGQSVLLIDTAGIRRRGRIGRRLERYGVLRALRAIDRADVILLVLDAMEAVTAQDMHIAGYIQQAAKSAVVVVNKWDLVEDKDTRVWERAIKSQLKFIEYASIVYTSAKLGEGVQEILPRAREVYQQRRKRVPTAEVNNVVQEAVARHTRPRRGRKQLKVLYVTQAEASPPTFVFFVNDATMVHFSYRRYLENKLREAFDFTGTPLRLVFKSRREP